MKTAILLFVSTLTLCLGCSSVERVEHYQREQWIPEAQKDLLNKEAEVTTIDGHMHDGNIIQISNDSLWMHCEYLKSPLALPLARVSLIAPSRNAGPPIGGFLAGLVVGGAIGASIGSNQEPDPRATDPFMSGLDRAANTAVGGLAGAAIGGLALGMTLGAVTSVTDYQIGHSAPHMAPVQSQETTDPARKGSEFR